MRRLLNAAACAALVIVTTGCPVTPANVPAGPGASAELSSLFQFTAYPGAQLLQEVVYPGSLGPLPMPGTGGYRTYWTQDSATQVFAHYEGLARQHQWMSNSGVANGGYPKPGYGDDSSLTLSRERFHVTITVQGLSADSTPPPPGYGGPVPYGPPPTPSPSPSPTPSPAPSGNPGAAPTPMPSGTPSSGPSLVIVNANVNSY